MSTDRATDTPPQPDPLLGLGLSEGLGPNATDRRAPLPDHDNHHNALRCPYCNPHRLVLVDPGETAVLIREKQKTEAMVEHWKREAMLHKSRADTQREELLRAWFVLKEYGHHPGRTDDRLSDCVRRALGGCF